MRIRNALSAALLCDWLLACHDLVDHLDNQSTTQHDSQL